MMTNINTVGNGRDEMGGGPECNKVGFFISHFSRSNYHLINTNQWKIPYFVIAHTAARIGVSRESADNSGEKKHLKYSQISFRHSQNHFMFGHVLFLHGCVCVLQACICCLF